MQCSIGQWEIPGAVKYFVLFKSPNGFRLEVGCGHYTPIGPDQLAVLSSLRCLNEYLSIWILDSLECKHSMEMFE